MLNHISHQRKLCQNYSHFYAIRWHKGFESDKIKYQQRDGDFSIYYPHLTHLSSPGYISLTDFCSALLWATHAASGPKAQTSIRSIKWDYVLCISYLYCDVLLSMSKRFSFNQLINQLINSLGMSWESSSWKTLQEKKGLGRTLNLKSKGARAGDQGTQ